MKKNSWQKGFGILEIIIYLIIFTVLLSITVTFIFWFVGSNKKLQAEREVANSAARIIKMIVSEITSAEGIYTPTTSAGQLSLESVRYLPSGEESSYIDFFICGTNLCFKRESQNPMVINSDSVEVAGFSIEKISDTIRISLAVSYKTNLPEYETEINLNTTACLRK